MERLTQPFHKPSSWQGALTVLPTGAQLLRLAITVKEGNDWVVSVWGIPFTPHEFLEKAIQAGHPVNLEANIPQVLREAIEENARTDHVELARKRTQTLKRWAMRSKQLESDESAFKNKLDPHVAAILKPKRLLLWREMMRELEYPDQAVFEEVVGGIPMTGEVEASGIFDPAFRPASKSVQELKESADTLSREVLSQVRSQSKAVDETVLNKTNEEVTKGWLIGPLDPGDVPSGSVVNRRFGLLQGEKVRLIDDFRPVNATVTVRETPRPHTADVLAATALQYMRAASGQRLQGKAFDLKAAYRQLPVHPASMWTTFVAIFNHVTGRPAVYQLRALPFGAARSVYAFLRAAHSLWWLACKALAIVWSFYYDDYVSLSVDQMASNTDHAIKAFLFILGWSFATDGEKFMHFSEVFTALGVTICLSESLDGRLTISNTAKRVSELAHVIQGILDDGFLPCGLALKLRGRMQFADGQVYGRAGRLCLRAVTEHAYRADAPTISQHCRAALCRFKKLVVGAKPRVVSARHGRPFVIFTDAAFDPSNRSWPCGVGGVLVDPSASPCMAMFSQVVPQSACMALGAEHKKTIIFEAELLAVVCALKLWSRVIDGSPTVIYVDNNSARDVAISGSARSEAACSLLDILLQEEFTAGIVPWYQRVPSPSNIADAPSRERLPSVKIRGVEVARCDIEHLLGEVCFQVSAK